MLIRYQDFVAHWSGDVLEDVIPVPFVKLSWSWLQIQPQNSTGSQKIARQEIEPLEGPKAGVGKLAEVQFPRWWFQRFVIQFDYSNTFQMGWNHQPVSVSSILYFLWRCIVPSPCVVFSGSKLQPVLHVLGNPVFWVPYCRKGDQLAIDIGFR